jgi:hypothetical protein
MQQVLSRGGEVSTSGRERELESVYSAKNVYTCMQKQK